MKHVIAYGFLVDIKNESRVTHALVSSNKTNIDNIKMFYKSSTRLRLGEYYIFSSRSLKNKDNNLNRYNILYINILFESA